eukprot:881020-Pelagomonas_calceolata.AAC.6
MHSPCVPCQRGVVQVPVKANIIGPTRLIFSSCFMPFPSCLFNCACACAYTVAYLEELQTRFCCTNGLLEHLDPSSLLLQSHAMLIAFSKQGRNSAVKSVTHGNVGKKAAVLLGRQDKHCKHTQLRNSVGHFQEKMGVCMQTLPLHNGHADTAGEC